VSASWWRNAAVYQIYPRSFADSNGDGIGDLEGIISRIPYLVALGVDAVWLSPFYPSALADGGYDVDDYRDVDTRIGTLADFDRMAAALHAAGIRLIIDIVPNHTSNRHEWFQAALAASPGSTERTRYLFRDGSGPGCDEPPSDWVSVFGGSAWQQVPDGQFYLHLFASEQPDLNWNNPDVRDDFLTTLRFWADRGVDGFRVDVAHGLVKDLSETPLPRWDDLDPEASDGSHPFWDRDAVHEIYQEWRRVFDEYDPPLTAVAEAWVPPTRRARYAHPAGLGQAFNFDLLAADFEADTFRTAISQNLALAEQSGSSSTWVLSNHDVVRHATRYGLPARASDATTWPGRDWLASGGVAPALDRAAGLERARAATLLMLALPGSAYLYQGEELGLHEVAEIPAAARQDPTFSRSSGADVGRDGCRVPLPWTTEHPSFGFGPGRSHLPQPEWFAEFAVEVQSERLGSTLSFYQGALALRRTRRASPAIEWVPSDPGVLHFSRGTWHCVTNFTDVPLAGVGGTVLISSQPTDETGTSDGLLPPRCTWWLEVSGN